jgi:hypothetical protein
MEQNSKEDGMKDFKKAISVVVLFSFVFSTCGKNANLERGNLVDASGVITPSTTTGEDNSQKGYKDELGGFTKSKSADGQLQMLDTSQGIPATDTTKPNPKDTQLWTYNYPKPKPGSLQLTFNNPSRVALNPHTFSFHGKVSPSDIHDSFLNKSVVDHAGVAVNGEGEQAAEHICVNGECDTDWYEFAGIRFHLREQDLPQNFPCFRIKSINFMTLSMDYKENIPDDYEMRCILHTDLGRRIWSHIIHKNEANARQEISFLFDNDDGVYDSEKIVAVEFSEEYTPRTDNDVRWRNRFNFSADEDIVRHGMTVSYYPKPEQERRKRDVEEAVEAVKRDLMIEKLLKRFREPLEKSMKRNGSLNDVNELIEISNQVFKNKGVTVNFNYNYNAGISITDSSNMDFNNIVIGKKAKLELKKVNELLRKVEKYQKRCGKRTENFIARKAGEIKNRAELQRAWNDEF